MKDLYIDFDGVILDTIPIMYNYMKENNIKKGDHLETRKFLSTLDFSEFINDKLILNNSIEKIKKLIQTEKFNISILSHVNSLEEGIIKVNYLRHYFKDITIILVPKAISKTKMVHSKNSILIDDYAGNLREWTEEGGISILFSKTLEDKGFPVINDLEEILKVVSE